MSASPDHPTPELDERIRRILDFERSWWQRRGPKERRIREELELLTGPKERRIREELELSPTRYHQLLMRAIDLPDALAYDPMLVRRLRRLRESRRRTRVARRLGLPS